MNEVVLVTEDGELYGPFDNEAEAVLFGNEFIYVGFTTEPMDLSTMVVTNRG